jgi:predicted NUDIX family phosphoesterase
VVERVLVIPRHAVPGGCDFTGVRAVGEDALDELRAIVTDEGRYVERPLAEQDPAHKQLIPYVVVRDGDRVFLMQRTTAGGDARLHGRASIGVGGHLNPVDAGEDPLLAGLRREWEEELDAGWDPEFRLVGLLNDDSDPVGAVHLGVVFEVQAGGRAVAVRERHKLRGAFVGHDEVAGAWDRLETWSRLAAGALGLVRDDEPAASGSDQR